MTRWQTVRTAALAALISSAAIGPFATVAARNAIDGHRSLIARRSNQTAASVLTEGVRLVSEKKNLDPFGQVRAVDTKDATDPLVKLIPANRLDTVYQRITLDRSTFWTAATRLPNGSGLIALVPAGDTDRNLASYRRRIWLQSLAAAAAAISVLSIAATIQRSRRRQRLQHQFELLVDAAHELRTPLAVIATIAGSTLAAPREQTRYVSALADVRIAADRASNGVNQLLELASLESGQVLPKMAQVRIDLVAEEVAATFAGEHDQVRYTPGPPLIVMADLSLIRQALNNVVRNAAARADEVDVRVGHQANRAVIEVADNGPGFSDRDLASAFTRYRRGDRNGSLGLGMSIVERIVSLHGGEVTASNRAQGGALVTLSLAIVENGSTT
jgi:signal transduction histidine kinase